MRRLAYIDVRNVWPMLVDGVRCYVLWGANRSITVEAARALLGLT